MEGTAALKEGFPLMGEVHCSHSDGSDPAACEKLLMQGNEQQRESKLEGMRSSERGEQLAAVFHPS